MVSGQYLLYEGIFEADLHFSDKEVALVDTIDSPKYGLSIEKVKSAYRIAYSLFDRIVFFLNKYFELDIASHKVSFKAIWSKDSDLLKSSRSNIPLKALHWIQKDLYNNSISKYKEHIDPTLRKINILRNTMEHRYLKVINNTYTSEDNQSDYDLYSETVTSEELYELGIYLLRTCREALILLGMAVNIEEIKRSKNSEDHYIIPPSSLPIYEDTWKL